MNPARRALLALAAVVLVVSVATYKWQNDGHASLPSQVFVGRALNAPSQATATPGRVVATAKPQVAATAKPRPTATRKVPSAPIVNPSYVVLIVLDGARPDYFSTPNIPHIKALMQNGTQYTNAWAGILESETPSGHASIATGSQPRSDGILSFDWADSENRSINLFSEQAVRQGLMENVMRQAGAPTIADMVHKRNPKAKVVALSGYKYYAADALGGPDADVIMYFTSHKNGTFGPTALPGHMPPSSIINTPGLTLPNRHYALGQGDHLAMKLADETFATMRQQVTLINLPEFDWPLGHVDGANRDQKDMHTLMQDFDGDLAQMEATYAKAGVLDRTLFILTADHGFAPIDHRIGNSVIDNAVLATGTKIIRDTYHTASYIWLQDESKDAQAAENIARLQNPYIQSVYFRSIGPNGPVYIRASGPDLLLAPGVEQANQWLLNTFNGPNGPDVVTFMAEQSMVWAGGEKTWKGDHGGNAWESQHLPLILSGPGVRRGYVSTYAAPIMDIAPTLLTLLGDPDTGMRGVPLADAFKSPSAAQKKSQQAQGASVGPVVAALQQESRREVAAKR
jgi:arylsulfatase A-like enzyme